MKKFTSLFLVFFFAASSYAQLNILKFEDSNIDNGNYLLSHVPSYCRASLGLESAHLTVSTDVVNLSSTHSVLLNYSGSWESNIVADGNWNSVDVTSYDNLRLTIYAPIALSDNQIPSLVLVHSKELLWDGKEKPLSNYINPIPAGRWVEINIPFADLGATQLSTNAGINLCCTGWGAESENPGKLYIDKIQFTSNSSSLVKDVSSISLKPYYADGKIGLNGYQGKLDITDLMGRSVCYTKMISGDILVDIPQGIYCVKTEKDITKILIK